MSETTKAKAAETKEAKAGERVRYTLPRNVLSNAKQQTVIVNGKAYILKVGVPVDVPKAVADILDNAIAQRYKAQDMQEELAQMAEVGK